jgi:hypothetical protein
MAEPNEKLQPATVQELYEAALKLSAEEREKLTAMLEQDLVDPDSWYATPEIAQAWNEEIAQRIKLIDEGKMGTVSWEEVQRSLRKILQQ